MLMTLTEEVGNELDAAHPCVSVEEREGGRDDGDDDNFENGMPRHPRLCADVLGPKHVELGKVSAVETAKDANKHKEEHLVEMPVLVVGDLEEDNLASTKGSIALKVAAATMAQKKERNMTLLGK